MEEQEARAAAIDAVLARVGPAATVVVDQKRNIGALVLQRARSADNPVAYLPGSAEKSARDMMPGVAKTDEIDAGVIAGAALGMPGALRPLAEEDAATASLRVLASQRELRARSRTQAKNRPRAVLLEADPELEVAVDPSCAWHVAVVAEIGSAADVAADADIAAVGALVAKALEGNEQYRCLLAVPGIGPKTAAALTTSVDISLFPSHDRPASYCGIAPADSRSGTSVRSTRPQRGGSKPLKNLLIFPCNSLTGTSNRFGRHYEECRAQGMRHNAALKAVARKRLRVIYSIMRNPRPYVEAV